MDYKFDLICWTNLIAANSQDLKEKNNYYYS